VIDREELRLRLRRFVRERPLGSAPVGDESLPAWDLSAPPIPAAVLVALVSHAEGPSVVLTQRTAHLTNHAAEISLPGGRIDPGDRSPTAAALREAHEEIGLPAEQVELLGELQPYDTVTGFRIHPVVGWVEQPVVFAPDAFEVQEVFEVPLSFLLDPANHHRGSITVNGTSRGFYVLPYPGRYIWGATAGILVHLARVLAQ
jgi:8-oxo-dGTP pyrophosphatase MutT (NUDIX family)